MIHHSINKWICCLPFCPINLTLVISGVDGSLSITIFGVDSISSLIVSALDDSVSSPINDFVCSNDVGSSVSNVAKKKEIITKSTKLSVRSLSL